MENRSLVTIAEHSKEKILYLLEMAKEFEKKPNRKILDGKVVATLFFEPPPVHDSVLKPLQTDWSPRYRIYRSQSNQFFKRRNIERYHHDGKQLR